MLGIDRRACIAVVLVRGVERVGILYSVQGRAMGYQISSLHVPPTRNSCSLAPLTRTTAMPYHASGIMPARTSVCLTVHRRHGISPLALPREAFPHCLGDHHSHAGDWVRPLGWSAQQRHERARPIFDPWVQATHSSCGTPAASKFADDCSLSSCCCCCCHCSIPSTHCVRRREH